jgi:hypothetical protein
MTIDKFLVSLPSNVKALRACELALLGTELLEWKSQTDCTEIIWGSSGRGSPKAKMVLRLYAKLGFLEQIVGRRTIGYKVSTQLQEWAQKNAATILGKQ